MEYIEKARVIKHVRKKIFLKNLFIYLTGRDTAREGTQAGGGREGEAGFQPSWEPNAGLNPRTLGSFVEPKAEA